MKTPVRLSQKAITALKLIYNTTYKARTRKLEEINEYSFAIILYWNNLEALLKVLQYKRKINEPYPRIAQGHETLVNHALKGFRLMPAKGGNSRLSDDEVEGAVKYMANEAGAEF